VLGDAGSTVHEENRLRILGIDRDEAHLRAAGSLADGHGIVEVVLARVALVAVGGDEARVDDARVVAESEELAGAVGATEPASIATIAAGTLAKNSSSFSRLRVLRSTIFSCESTPQMANEFLAKPRPKRIMSWISSLVVWKG
jgi:hypothetical protein